MTTTRRTVLAGGFALSAGALAASAASAATRTVTGAVVAKTKAGLLRGLHDRGVLSFRGVPYAGDTGGAFRFRRPQPVAPWSGIRDATSFGDRAPQSGDSPRKSATEKPEYNVWTSFAATGRMSENCLNLNVWTPALTGQRPVMVWLHPGGFQSGAGAEPPTHGANLAMFGDVVVVTINHRLTALGYMYLNRWTSGLSPEDANPGQQDIIAALEWVRDNIEAFGGDAGNVTIFGQSGGGAKVCSLMATPRAKGLFHKAICQSGSYIECTSPELSTRGAAMLARRLGVAPGDLDALRRVPAQALVDAATDLARLDIHRMTDPVLDGALMPYQPFSPEAVALSADVPLMIGSTATEATSLNGDYEAFDLDWAGLKAKWMKPYETSFGLLQPREIDVDDQIAAFRAALPGESPSQLYFRYSSDIWTILNAITVADRQSAGGRAPVYMYELGYSTPVDGGRWGSPHSLDVPLIFRTMADAPSIVPVDAASHVVSEQMSAAWVAFAHTGDPSNKRLPAWPRFDRKERNAMVFDVQSKVVSDYRGADRRILDGVPTLRV